MNTLIDVRLADIPPQTIAAIKRRAHLERSAAVAEALTAGFAWVGAVVREAGIAARLSEAPRPYRTHSPHRCG